MEKEWQTAFKCDLTRIKKKKTKMKKLNPKRKDTKRNKTKHTILYTLREQEREREQR